MLDETTKKMKKLKRNLVDWYAAVKLGMVMARNPNASKIMLGMADTVWKLFLKAKESGRPMLQRVGSASMDTGIPWEHEFTLWVSTPSSGDPFQRLEVLANREQFLLDILYGLLESGEIKNEMSARQIRFYVNEWRTKSPSEQP